MNSKKIIGLILCLGFFNTLLADNTCNTDNRFAYSIQEEGNNSKSICFYEKTSSGFAPITEKAIPGDIWLKITSTPSRKEDILTTLIMFGLGACMVGVPGTFLMSLAAGVGGTIMGGTLSTEAIFTIPSIVLTLGFPSLMTGIFTAPFLESNREKAAELNQFFQQETKIITYDDENLFRAYQQQIKRSENMMNKSNTSSSSCHFF